MNEELHNIEEPEISANTGWQQMQTLLNEYLPVQKPSLFRKILVPGIYIVMTLVIFLLTTLQLDNDGFYLLGINKNSSLITGLKTSLDPALASGNYSKRFSGKPTLLTGSLMSIKNNGPQGALYNRRTLQLWTGNANGSKTRVNKVTSSNSETETQVSKVTQSDEEVITGGIAKGEGGGTIYAPEDILPAGINSAKLRKPNKKIINKNTWNFFGGMGINAIAGTSQNLQPYPVVEARYLVNRRLYLSGGLSAWSPVSTIASGISKTIHVNDTTNNINLYNETTTYSQLHYMDLPFSLGINLTKNISLQSGVQISFLLGKRTKKVLVPYDFQMNGVDPRLTTSLAAFPGIQQDYDVQVRKIDYRFVAGIRYSIKKTAINLGYQYGLQSVGSNTNTKGENNHVLSVDVLFRLR